VLCNPKMLGQHLPQRTTRSADPSDGAKFETLRLSKCGLGFRQI
jgi:hypothetical protein